MVPHPASRCLAVALVAVVLAACTPEIPQDPTPAARAFALFDPGAEKPVVPTPNDLAVDPVTGALNIPDADNATEAEKQFNQYLRTLDGFPTSSVATTAFSAPLLPSSVNSGAVRVLDITNPAAITPVTPSKVAYNPTTLQVSIAAPLKKGHVYSFAVIGGPTGVQDEQGETVLGSPAFVLVRTSSPLVDCTDLLSDECRPTTSLITGTDEADIRTKAVTLERVRQSYQPGLGYLEAHGVPRGNVVAFWNFRTTAQGLATFDPAASIVPFPNDVLIDQTTGKVKLPADPKDDADTAALKGGLNTLDGFSTTAILVTEAGATTGAADVRIDGNTLALSQFVAINLGNPPASLAEVVPLSLVCKAGVGKVCGDATPTEPDQIQLTPAVPLKPHTRYAILWLKGAKGIDHRPLNATPAFALTRLAAPLVANGHSTLGTLDDATAKALEPLRAATNLYLTVAEGSGIVREDVLLSWSFITQSITEPAATQPITATSLRAYPFTKGASSAVVGGANNVTPFPLGALDPALTSNVRVAVEGAITTLNPLDPNGFEKDLATGQALPTEGSFTAGGLANPRVETVKFVLAIPKTNAAVTARGGKIPVVIFQHGITGHRRQTLLIANAIAAAGYATLGIDMAMHGDRSYCRADAECAVGVCDATAGSATQHRCTSGYLPKPGDPFGGAAISGRGYFSATNLFGTRDHFRQHIIDITQVIRSLQNDTDGLGAIVVDDGATVGTTEVLDPTSPRYIGISLGGMVGALVTATNPEIPKAVLSVPGGGLVDIILDAPAGGSFASTLAGLNAFLSSKQMPPGSQGYDNFLATARWVLDPADPQNYGQALITAPLKSALPPGAVGSPKAVFVTSMAGDNTIPNSCTDILIRSIKGPLGSPALPTSNYKEQRYTGGGHGFLLDFSSNPTLAATAQADAVNWVAP